MALTNEGTITSRLVEEFSKEFDIPKAEITQAAHVAWVELLASRDDIRKKGEETLAYIKEHNLHGIVLAGRPYHVDPEINHGIPEMLTVMVLPFYRRFYFTFSSC